MTEQTDAVRAADAGSVPGARRPPLSVVIATRNRPDLLDRCLQYVTAGGLGDDEIVVVDSASANTETARVAESYGVGYVRVEQRGLSRARNAGWRAAGNELVAFTDDDVRVDPGWRDAIAVALAEPENTFVTGWIDVPPEQAEVVDPQPHIVEPVRHRLDRNAPRYYGAGANMGVRRSALSDVGGFDERLGVGTWFSAAEDADLFDRLVRAGHVGEYRPEVRVQHDAWRSTRQWLRQQWGYGKGSGARIRLLLHHDRPRAWRSARRLFWKRGIKLALRRLRAGWWAGALSTCVRLTGTVAGFTLALALLLSTWPAAETRHRHDG